MEGLSGTICLCHGQYWQTEVLMLEHQVQYFYTNNLINQEKYDDICKFIDVYHGDLDELQKFMHELEAKEKKLKEREAEIERQETTLSIRQLNIHIREMGLDIREEKLNREIAATEREY